MVIFLEILKVFAQLFFLITLRFKMHISTGSISPYLAYFCMAKSRHNNAIIKMFFLNKYLNRCLIVTTVVVIEALLV